MDTPSTPSETPKPVYQKQTTGTLHGDVKEAVKRLSVDDFGKIGEIPCMRNSLMSGIASGVGVGLIRTMTLHTNRMAGLHWAFGTFMVISVGTWTMCQKALNDERRRVQTVVEAMPRRLAKQQEEAAAKSQSDSQ